MSEDYQPKLYYLIESPYSLKIMFHPEAIIVLDSSTKINYIVPVNVWNYYKNYYYYLGLEDYNIGLEDDKLGLDDDNLSTKTNLENKT